MIKLTQTSIDMIKNITFIFLIALTGVFFTKNYLPYILGLLLGTVFSIVKLILLEKSIDKSLEMDGTPAQNYIFTQYILRYILTALVLFFAVTDKNLNIIGFIIGLFSLQLSAYITGFKKKE